MVNPCHLCGLWALTATTLIVGQPAVSLALATHAAPRSNPSILEQPLPLAFLFKFRDEEDKDKPGRTAATGARGRGVCNSDSTNTSTSTNTNTSTKNFTPLAPLKGIGLTTDSHPTFFWYLPDSPNKPLVFKLWNGDELIWEQTFPQPPAGLMQVELPQEKAPLVQKREYSWTVRIICNPERNDKNPLVTAWIKRIAEPTELTKKLTPATSLPADLLQRADAYASEGIWYNTLQTLIAVRQIAPQNSSAKENLLNLLQQGDLSEVGEDLVLLR